MSAVYNFQPDIGLAWVTGQRSRRSLNIVSLAALLRRTNETSWKAEAQLL